MKTTKIFLISMLMIFSHFASSTPIKIELITDPIPGSPGWQQLGSTMAMGSLMQQLGFGGDYEYYMEDETLNDPYVGEQWLQDNGYLAGDDRIFGLPDTDIDIDFYSEFLPGLDEYVVEFTVTPPGSPDGVYNEVFQNGITFEEFRAGIDALVAQAIADGRFTIPEPSTLALFAVGLLAVGLRKRKKRHPGQLHSTTFLVNKR